MLGVVYLGGWPLGLLLVGAAAAGQSEVYRLMARDKLNPLVEIGCFIGGLVVIAPLWPAAGGAALIGVLGLLGTMPFRRDDHPFRSLAATIFGIIYPAVLLSSVLYVREGPAEVIGEAGAFTFTAGVIVLVWAADIGAYYVGKTWGKRPLAPKVSPKKTWEGLAGGTAAALFAALVVRGLALDFLPWIHVIVIGLICAVCSPVGDLIESRLKRSVQVKDAGSLLPGHGGIMDRIDGLVFALPVVVLYTRYIAGLW